MFEDGNAFWPRCFSEVFYYLEHGAEGRLLWNRAEGLSYQFASSNSIMRDTKLSVIGSCRGAARVDGAVGTSMTEAFRNAGSQIALGWVKEKHG